MKLRDRIASIRRTFPLIHPGFGRFLHAKPSDINRRSKQIVLVTVLWSADGRVSLHRTAFERKQSMSVAEWSGWLQVNSPKIMSNSVLAYVNRAFGSSWNIDRVFGWYIAPRRSAR